MTVKEISPNDAKAMLDDGRTLLIDVRDPAEHAREHIRGARLVPLAQCERADFSGDRDKIAVFHCRTGTRTAMNAARLSGTGFREIYIVKGGLDAWRAAGLPVQLDRKVPIDIMRQVQIGAGSLMLLGVLLGVLASPWFLLLSAFVGTGLVFAGVTGFCGMARLLALMPWNRAQLRLATDKPA